MESKSTRLPDLADLEAARRRIEGVASRTPLIDSPALSKRFGREVYLKLECFQPIKVFKIRGAYNMISQFDEKSVVTVSSGNHGMAVAFSARKLGKTCVVVLPENPVQEKADAIAEYGAAIIKFGGDHAAREAKAIQLAGESGSALVPPFNHPDIIAGQGTCGLEISEQLDEFDSVVVPVGGGGLVSGIAIALKEKGGSAKVFGVEPEGAAKLKASLAAGKIVKVSNPNSIADGLIPPAVGDLTFEACSRYVDGVFAVPDAEIMSAMRLLIKEARIIPEPSAAASLAPLLSKESADMLGRRVVLVISGGNVSQKLLQQVLASS